MLRLARAATGSALLLLAIHVVSAQADPRTGDPALVTAAHPPSPTAATAVAGHADPGAAVLSGAAESAVSPPTRLGDLEAWLDYQSRGHISSLPEEARLFYRKGLLLHQSGGEDDAVRLVRGASILDPSYVGPHLTLASWFLLRDPSQALLQYAAVLELARQNFILQLVLVANVLYLGLQALFLGLLCAGFLMVLVHQRELRHSWHERLGMFLTPATARWWSWGFLILPFFAGFGVALPTVVFLGLLWPSLRASGRALFVTLALVLTATPWVASSLDRLAVPLREGRGPYWGVALLENEPYSQERQAALTRLAARHPDNPFVQFGLGWVARRGGDLVTAEAAYRHALELWPKDDRVMNDLGNTLAMEGRTDEALELYGHATDTDPSNAAAWFNASQIHTQRFDYRAATEALGRASAHNFDMVKVYQSRATNDGALPLVDQWLSPQTFWTRLDIRPSLLPVAPVVPPSWRNRIECTGLPFSALVVVLSALALWLGAWQRRAILLRNCSNCGAVVCRRCAQRRRELALCPACAAVESRAESPDFARVLLLQHQRGVAGRRGLARTALATLVPGYGLMALRSVFAPVVLLTWTAALAAGTLGQAVPFSYEPRLTLANAEIPLPAQIVLWLLLYTFSLAGYFVHAARADAPSSSAGPRRGRSTPPARRTHAAAA